MRPCIRITVPWIPPTEDEKSDGETIEREWARQALGALREAIECAGIGTDRNDP